MAVWVKMNRSKVVGWVSRVTGFTVLFVAGLSAAMASENEWHLPLDLNSTELNQALARSQAQSAGMKNTTQQRLQPILNWGKRNLDWLVHLNSLRGASAKLSFSSKATQTGIPIDAPSRYSPSLIEGRVAALKATLPASMSSILDDSSVAFPDSLPIAEADYLSFGRQVDKLYQSATRWILLEPYLDELTDAAQEDIRGFYFLEHLDGLDAKLADVSALSPDLKASVIDALAGVCLNTLGRHDDCLTEIGRELASTSDLRSYYSSYRATSSAIYEGFFRITDEAAAHRSDFVWDEKSSYLPFKDPGSETFRAFLEDNIADEWRFGTWTFHLDFRPEAGPNLAFQPGVTPHVDGLGGNRITMDANAPLTEYNVQWTIRHEFGHVLGFPDCYIEFYDAPHSEMVNYQLDIENLMCSRVGHIQARHVQELRRAYSKSI